MKNKILAVILPLFVSVSCQITNIDDSNEISASLYNTNQYSPIINNNYEEINKTGTLIKGRWMHYGPYAEENTIKATLSVKPDVRATLYIRKDAKATWTGYDSRVRIYGTLDGSCSVNGAGEYYVSIYTSAMTSDNADMSYNLTITVSKNDTENPKGNEGDDCKFDSECKEGLVCSNFNINDRVVGTEYISAAMCIQELMKDEFISDEYVKIYAGTTRETTIAAEGLATVAMNAFLSVEIDMGWYDSSEDLTFDIIAGNTGYDTHFNLSDVDPSKYTIDFIGRSQILKINDLPINCPRDDAVNGNWTLRVKNSNVKYWVKLVGWGLKLSSRWD